VSRVIAEHPDWITATNQAITSGVRKRIASETEFRANAEASLIVCFNELGKTKIPERHREMVIDSIKNSKLVGGSTYAENL
jgi:hypothetical protein